MSRPSEDLQVEHLQTLRDATRQKTAVASLAWIAEGHALIPGTSPHAVASAALAAEERHFPRATEAVIAITRELARSTLDPATMLFETDLMPQAAQLRESLDLLASKCSSGSLTDVSATAVRNAQHADNGVIEVLCLVAGVSYDELRDRLPAAHLPPPVRGPFTTSQLNAAFAEIDSIIQGRSTSPVAEAIPAQPVELVSAVGGASAVGGWSRIEELRRNGVPYEILLAQRVVGGAWLQHRNRTSKRPTRAVACDLRERLRARGLNVVLAIGYGGDAKQGDINELVGGAGDVGLVVRTSGDYRPFYAVTFALAKDGGTARKTGATKIEAALPRVPIAVVTLGGGWAERNETADLVRAFAGAVFTELTLDDLVETIASAAPDRTEDT